MAKMTKSQLMVNMSDEQKATAKLVGNNTLEYMDGETKVIRHFMTDILRFEPDGTIVFNTDGHRTVTTKLRLKQFQEFVGIWSERRVWYAQTYKRIYYGNENKFYWGYDSEAIKYVFADGMTFHPDRGIENAGKEPDKELIKKIRKFSKEFAKALPIEMPGPGDCFICGIEYSNPDYINQAHLLSHIEENYFVPKLLWNALREAQRGDYLFVCAFKGTHQGSYYSQLLDSCRSQYAKDLFAYLYKRIIDRG